MPKYAVGVISFFDNVNTVKIIEAEDGLDAMRLALEYPIEEFPFKSYEEAQYHFFNADMSVSEPVLLDESPTNDNPVIDHSWDKFRESGLLWWVNSLLHTFGWAISITLANGKVVSAMPARVVFRGFDEKSNTAGYKKVSKYMAENASDLLKESES